MGLTRTAAVFAAGYALGRPGGRERLVELARRPEAVRLRKRGAGLASKATSAVRRGVAARRGPVESHPDSASTGTLPPANP